MMPSRNDPCPCGSGKKYKKCHLLETERARFASRSPLHDLDNELVERLLRFASKELRAELQQAVDEYEAVAPFDVTEQFASPWLAYEVLLGGKTLSTWYREKRRSRLDERQHAWLDAQDQSWLGIWEVSAVDPGHGFSLHDLITGEKRNVRDVAGSRAAIVRNGVLGRVVDFEGASLLCGAFPVPLGPLDTAEIVTLFRKEARLKGGVPVETMRDHGVASLLFEIWVDRVKELREQRSRPPRLMNNDGDPFLLTTDHYKFDPSMTSEVQAGIGALEGVQEPTVTEKRRDYVFMRESDQIVVGTAIVENGYLSLETNSLRRADALRSRIEEVLGSHIGSSIRETMDPTSEKAREAAVSRDDSTSGESDIDPAQSGAIIRELKERHYADWVDHPLPMFDGKTPRQAKRSRAGREKLIALLKQFESDEATQPENERFDVGRLWKELGLSPD